MTLVRHKMATTLGDSQVLTLQGLKSMKVSCTGGAAWITAGDGREVTVRDGKSASLDHPGKVAIQGWPNAKVEIAWR